MADEIDPDVRAMANAYLQEKGGSRGAKALRAILERGYVTTGDMKALGYDHPPRALADLRDHGIPLEKEMVRNADGKRMASYRLGTSASIRTGQVGRTNFTKKFRNALFERYGEIDCITRAAHSCGALQIDHRIPYRIGGDAGLKTNDVDAYMLLDAKSQRLKSWACENCANYSDLKDPLVCKACFWAYPEQYEHVAMEQQRRTDVVWQGDDDVATHDKLVRKAKSLGIELPELLRQLGKQNLER